MKFKEYFTLPQNQVNPNTSNEYVQEKLSAISKYTGDDHRIENYRMMT